MIHSGCAEKNEIVCIRKKKNLSQPTVRKLALVVYVFYCFQIQRYNSRYN